MIFLKALVTARNICRMYGRIGLLKAIYNKLRGYDLLFGFEEYVDDSALENCDLQSLPVLENGPLISILMPMYNPDIKWLKVAIESVRKQVYMNWELCIIDDSSADRKGVECVYEYMKKDKRIRVQCSDKNNGISITTNKAADMAEGEYITFLDQDDELSCDAMYWLAKSIIDNTGADFLYSDECKIDELGNKSCFLLKPDVLTPCLMLNNMFAGHLVAYSKSFFLNNGGFDSRYDFAQDYECAIRLQAHANVMVHIPKVLYHWRMLPTSTASGGKSFAQYLNMLVAKQYLLKNGIVANITKIGDYNCPIMLGVEKKVSIIFVLVDIGESMDGLAEILKNTYYGSFEVVVVCEAKYKKIISYRFSFISNMKIIDSNSNVTYVQKIKTGIVAAQYENIIIVHPWCRIMEHNWIKILLDYLDVPNVGAVSPMVIDGEGRVIYAGGSCEFSNDYNISGTPYQSYQMDKEYNEYLLNPNVARECAFLSNYCIAYNREKLKLELEYYICEHTLTDFVSYEVKKQKKACVYVPHVKMICSSNKKIENYTSYYAALCNCKGMYGEDKFFTNAMKRALYDPVPLGINVYNSRSASYNPEKKSVLIITHELSLTGAPIVVFDAAKEMLRFGYNVVVASPIDGYLRSEYEKIGIVVIIDGRLEHGRFSDFESSRIEMGWFFDYFVKEFDLLFVSTLSGHNFVSRYYDSGVPIFWWIHEGRYTYDIVGGSVFKEIPQNVYVYCGGIYVHEMLCKYGYKYNEKILLYGVDDPAKDYVPCRSDEKVKFLMVGSIDERKAQDLVFSAIKKLPESIMDKAEFIFIGGKTFSPVYKQVISESKNYDNVTVLPPMSRLDLYEMYKKADCLLCPSRDDPMPVVVTEMMSLSKVVVCSTDVGQSRYIQDGVNGYVIGRDDVDGLVKKIITVVTDRDQANLIGKEARAIFETYFSIEMFRENLSKELNFILSKGKIGVQR